MPKRHDTPHFLPVPIPQEKEDGERLPADAFNFLIRQAIAALPHSESGIDAARARAVTIGMMEALDPKDVMEAMLCTQAAVMHNLTMDCASRASISTGPDRDLALNQANKASRTFATLSEALNRHRGKGQQKMTVEHVHIHGGQAVIGNVHAGAGGANPILGGGSKKRKQPHG